MELALAAVVAVGALVFAFTRLGRARDAEQAAEPPKKRMSRRERKLEQLRAADPLPEPKSIFDIMQEEAADLGVNEVPGGEGLELPVKLKVWHRDHQIREACGGAVRYVLVTDVSPSEATTADVQLACADGSRSRPQPMARSEANGTVEPAAPHDHGGDIPR